jgi:hypothetical protein
MIELDGNNVPNEYEFPGYNDDMGWSNGKFVLGYREYPLIPRQEPRMIFFNRADGHENRRRAARFEVMGKRGKGRDRFRQ